MSDIHLTAHQVKRPLRPFAIAALAAGWTITVRRGGHLMWRSPDGAIVMTPSTSSYPRSLANTRSLLRRHGLQV